LPSLAIKNDGGSVTQNIETPTSSTDRDQSEFCDLSVIGHVVGRSVNFPRGEVRIHEGRIVEVREAPSQAGAGERIDVGDAYVLPGVIDAHVHSLSDPREGIEAATRSAAAGGVTTILEMPFDRPGPIWTVDRLLAKQQMVAEQALVDVGLFATVHPAGRGDSVADLAEAGAVTFKVSTYHTDPDRFPRTPDSAMIEVFAAAAAYDRRVCVHAESDDMVRAYVAATQQRDGTSEPTLHCASRPPVTETAAVASTLELANAAGAQVHLVHMSLPHSIELVRNLARTGVDVSAEACPQYLLFTEDDMHAAGALLKVNPPLRSAADAAGLWRLFAADQIDVISSDHAPWQLSEKTKPNIFDNASGAPGVETVFNAVAGTALHDHDVSIESLVRAYCWRPAELFGIDHRKGDLAPGLDGDITVFDPNTEWVVDGAAMSSNAGWTPFDGHHLRGKVTLAVSRGRVIFDGKQVTAEPGDGRVLEHRTQASDPAAKVPTP
jgi:allantoinase